MVGKKTCLIAFVLMIVVMALVILSGRTVAQTPIGAAFTYQGRLLDGADVPVTGLCDMDFGLYDEVIAGNQISSTVTITSVVMNDGYFAASVDFSASSFNGEARWLEMTATCPPGGVPVTMTRQAISVVPYALYALNSSGVTSTVYITESFYYTPAYHLQGWETITGTPASYTPTTHTQDWSTITGPPASYTPTVHTQGWGTITGTPSTYTPTTHLHSGSDITLTGSAAHVAYWSGTNTLTNSAGATLDNAGNVAFNGYIEVVNDNGRVQSLGDFSIESGATVTILSSPSGAQYSYVSGLLSAGGSNGVRVAAVIAGITWMKHGTSNVGYATVQNLTTLPVQRGWGAGTGTLAFSITGNGTSNLALTLTNTGDYEVRVNVLLIGIRLGV